MAAVPAGMGFGSALKGAASSAGPQLAQGLGQGVGAAGANALASSLGGGGASNPAPQLPTPPAGSGFQIQPIVSTGSSASPLNFSAGNATGVGPANNMNPQLMRLIQLMNSMGMRG